MTMIMEKPWDPVFVEGKYAIRLRIGRGKRSRHATLSARTARRLACALLLEAEKREALESSHRTNGLPRPIDRALAALGRFQSNDERLRKRQKDREFRRYLKQR